MEDFEGPRSSVELAAAGTVDVALASATADGASFGAFQSTPPPTLVSLLSLAPLVAARFLGTDASSSRSGSLVGRGALASSQPVRGPEYNDN